MSPAEIRAARTALGLSQTATARLVGVDARTWRRWEAGDWPIPAPAARLLRLLRVESVRRRLDAMALSKPATPAR